MIEENNVKLTKTKHFWLILVAFVGGIGLVIAIVMLNVFGFFTHTSGYLALDALPESGLAYNGDVRCYVYFNGNDMSVRTDKARANQAYSNALKAAFKRTDPTRIYEDSASLGRINGNLNTDVKVDSTVYEVLQQFAALSKIENNYSIHAGPIYDCWQLLVNNHLLQGEGDLDPSADAEMATMLNELSAYTFAKEHVDLQFKADNVVRLTVSEEYQEFLKSHDISSPLVSLNSLREIYEVNEVRKSLEEAGFTDGYITSKRGYGVTLSGLSALEHKVNLPSDPTGSAGATIQIKGVHCFAKNPRYYIPGNDPLLNYVHVKDGNKTYRSLYVDLSDGISHDEIMYSFLFHQGEDLLTLALEAEKNFQVRSLEGLKSYAQGLRADTDYAFFIKEEPATVYIGESLKNSLTILKPDSLSSKAL